MPDRPKNAPFRWAALALALAASPAAAQRAAGALVGTVTDAERGTPVPDVELRVVGTAVRARTDSAGRFRLASLPRGTHTVVVRRVGWVGDSTDVELDADSTELDFALVRSATVLPGVNVEESRVPGRLQEFEERRKARRGGYYVAPETLANSAGRTFPDILRVAVPPLDIQRAPDGTLYPATRRHMTRTIGGKNAPCVPRLFLDGLQLSDSTVSSISPSDLAGAEYHDVATTPVQYRRTGTECGVLLLWSR